MKSRAILNKKHTFEVGRTLFKVDTKYVPIKPIGQGSYGVVCSAINTETNKKVAIKKINNVFDSQADALRTLRELIILRSVRHDYVIGLKDVMISSSRSTFTEIYLVYELMDTDLNRIIMSRQHLSPDLCKYLMFQFLQGLEYLHFANILHRDLKPANLLVNLNADLKICDFGLARPCRDDGGSMTEYVVTRWYRAPELLVRSNSYDAAIDVWSVGCIFAEIIGGQGQPVFPGKDPLDQMRLIIKFLGIPSDSDLEFIQDPLAIKFIKQLPYSRGVSLDAQYPCADPLALDLLQKMLVFDPRKRITITEALQHPYMSDLYDPTAYPPARKPVDIDVDLDVEETKLRDYMWKEMLFYHYNS